MKRLALVVPLSLLLIFVLLFDAFSSLKKALLILVNVPLALIGGFIVRMDDKQIDASVASQINNLKQRLTR